MRVTFKVNGFKELEQALIALADEFSVSKATGNNILRRTLVRAAKPIEVAAERLAPVRTGTTRESVGTFTALAKNQRSQHTRKSTVEVYVGSSSSFAHLPEFGSAHQAPHAFLRPAFDANSEAVLEIIKGALGDEIEKAARRLAKKRAKAGP